MKSILLFLLLLSVSKTQAQNDTIYYNKKWDVCNALDAQYYRLIVKENNLFKVKDCYLNGIVQMKGVCSSLNPDVKEGLFMYYDSLGKITSEQNYITGVLNGSSKYYYKNGKVSDFKVYENGKLKMAKYYTEAGKDTTASAFTLVEVMPEFVGGFNKFMSFLSENIKYPKQERKLKIQGKVYLTFIIEADGSIGEVKVLKGVESGKALEEEAI